jgi:hypothetical protein
LTAALRIDLISSITRPENLFGLQQQQAAGSRMVLCNEDRRPVDGANLRHRVFYRILATTGRRRIRVHHLGHTVASLLVKTARPGQLGHGSIQTTLDRYGHLMPDVHEAEARKLDQLVFSAARRPRWAKPAMGQRRPSWCVHRVQNEGRHGNGVSAVCANPVICLGCGGRI